jgi:putative transposase
MQPYSLDLRTRVAAACREPKARKTQVAKRFGVSCSFVSDLLRRERATGSLAPKPASGGPERVLCPADQAWLVAYVGQHADATLAEVGAAWRAHSARPVCQTCIWNVLDEHKLRRKKKSARHGT